ncbi:MAG: hypothetical protein PHX16_06725, partial [Syntrophaceticus sp.]|nr:hypothetical protein [Syntrophaceticus sp.]
PMPRHSESNHQNATETVPSASSAVGHLFHRLYITTESSVCQTKSAGEGYRFIALRRLGIYGAGTVRNNLRAALLFYSWRSGVYYYQKG